MAFAAYLLDIEGTTTPIDFVTRTLFPFARMGLAEYVRQHPSLPDLEAERVADGFEGDPLAYLNWLMDQDRKSPALKRIQGEIWQEGYASGELKGEVYPDVVPALRRWRASGARVFIYSSGSVLAQQLLFGHSVEGDLTPLLDGYFDTGVGPKREAASYRRIAEAIGAPPEGILFLSDVQAEVDAAREAGLGARRVDREPTQAPDTAAIDSFDAVP